jgi:hypothetical protein
MTRLTLHYPKGRSLAVTFNCSLQTAMGYKQGFVQSGEFTEDQITVEAVESESGVSPNDD